MNREKRRAKSIEVLKQINFLLDQHKQVRGFVSCSIKDCKQCMGIMELSKKLTEIQSDIGPDKGEFVPDISSRTVEEYVTLCSTWDDKEIMVMWGVELPEFTKWKKQKNLVGSKRNKLKLTLQEYLDYKERGETDENIAALCGVSHGAISKFKEKFNLKTTIKDFGFERKQWNS